MSISPGDSSPVSNCPVSTSIQKFWEEYEGDLTIGPQKDIVLLLGGTRQGLSTTASFLVDDDLESKRSKTVRVSHHIVDKNGRIGTHLESETFVPELLIDPETGAAIYDCPGFDNTKGPEYQVAVTRFLNKLISSAESVKLVFVVDHAIVKDSRPDQFLGLIEKVFTLLENFEKFSDGIAMVVTKVLDHNDVDDDRSINAIADSLKNLERKLQGIIDGTTDSYFSRNFLRKAIQFIEILLINQNDQYQRIGIIRAPSSVGPLRDMEVFQNEKSILKKIIHENIKYVPTGDTKFGYPIAKWLLKHIQADWCVDNTPRNFE